jgi:phosphoglycerate dehydrogenase-like enzyme
MPRSADQPLPTPFKPKHAFIGADQHAEFAAAFRGRRPDLEYRGARLADITADDLAWADTYIGFRRPPLPTMGSVRWVHCTGAGVDAWLYPKALPADILLTKTSESFGPMIAEWALARALAFTQHLRALEDDQRAHRWKKLERSPQLMRGTTAVIAGTGDVGSHVARLFAALGCTVHGVSRSGRGDPSVFSKVSPVAALPEVVPSADWLVLMIPLTAETDGLVNRKLLARCNGAVLINAGRGRVIEESALPDALERGWLRGAALDVFEVEPLPTSSPLWDDPRVMISPHNSGPTTIAATVPGFVESLEAIERGIVPPLAVDRARQY